MKRPPPADPLAAATLGAAPPAPVTVVLPRLPVAKSNHTRSRVFTPKGGKPRAMTYTGAPARRFQEEVEAALLPAVAAHLGTVFEGPVGVLVLITYKRLNKDGKTERKSIPDCDGGMKAIMDAAQAVGLYSNDRQVCDQRSQRRPGDADETRITFRALVLDGGWQMPSVAGRKEWAERQRGDRLDHEREGYVAPGQAVARCWYDDILIGPNRHEQEIWLFVGAPGRIGRLAGAVVCGTCARELGLPAASRLMHASELEPFPQAQRSAILARRAERLLGPHPTLLFARAARDLIRRRRPIAPPQEPALLVGQRVYAALDRLDARHAALHATLHAVPGLEPQGPVSRRGPPEPLQRAQKASLA